MENIKLDEKAHERMEKILTKIAEEHSIDNVASIDISLSKDTGLIKFKTAYGPATQQAIDQNANQGKGPLQSNQNVAPGQGWLNQVQQTVKNTIPTQPAQPETEYTNAQGDRIWAEKNNPGMYWVASAGTPPAQGKKMQLDPSTLMAKGTTPTAPANNTANNAGITNEVNPAKIVPGATPTSGEPDMTAQATAEGKTFVGIDNFGKQIFRDPSGQNVTYFEGRAIPAANQSNQAPVVNQNPAGTPGSV